MAGNQIIPTSGGGKLLPKLIGTLVLLAVLALVIKHPTSAAAWVNSLWANGTAAVDGISSFLQAVTAK